MSLQDVFVEELRDLYSAENQLVKALPKVAKAVSNKELKSLIQEHLEETKVQVQRLKEVFEHLGKKPTGQHCNGMEGLVKEGTEAIESSEEGASKDVNLIGAALRVEHYEIAGYTTAIAIAKALGHKEIAGLLTETLEEEKSAGRNLFNESKPILREAASEQDSDTEEEDDEPEDEEEAESARKSEEDEEEAESARKSEEDEEEAEPELIEH